jgi:anti-sigma factor RsiW
VTAAPNIQPGEQPRRPELPSAFARDCAFAAESLEAFALGALPVDDAARVERHVSSCPRCAHLLDQAAGVVAFLPFLAQSVAVPDAMFAGVLARIDRDQTLPAPVSLPNLNPWETDEPARSWTIPSSKDAYANSISTVSGIAAAARRRRVNWDVWAAPLAAMPLVLALAIVGGWAMNTRSNLQDQKTALQAVQKENQQLNAQLLTYPSATTTADTDGPADFQLASVNSSSAHGALTQLSNNKGVSVEVWNLPTSIKKCEIEVETMDGRRTIAGMLTINGNGSGNGTYVLDQPLDLYRYVHVIPVAADAGDPTAQVADLLMAQINSNLGEAGGTEANSSSR